MKKRRAVALILSIAMVFHFLLPDGVMVGAVAAAETDSSVGTSTVVDLKATGKATPAEAFAKANMLISSDVSDLAKINFGFDLALDNDYLIEKYTEVIDQVEGLLGDEAALKAALNGMAEDVLPTIQVQAVIQRKNGNTEILDQISDQTGYMTTNLDGESNVAIGEYAFKNVDDEIQFTCEFYKFVYCKKDVTASFSIEGTLKNALGLTEDAHISVDANGNIVISVDKKPQDPNANPDAEQYVIKKSCAVDTPYAEYTILVSALDSAYLNGTKLVDTLPANLDVMSVQLVIDSGTEQDITKEVTWDTGTLSYTFEALKDENPTSNKIQTAIMTVKMIADEATYKAAMLSPTAVEINCTNTAELFKEDGSTSLGTATAVGTMAFPMFMTKNYVVDSRDNSKYDWALEVNASFSHISETYLIDMINGSHHYIADSVQVNGVSVSIKELTAESGLPEYEGLDITEDDGHTVRNNVGALFDTYNDGTVQAVYYKTAAGKSVLIIPLDSYLQADSTNADALGKDLKITYSTKLNETDVDNIFNSGSDFETVKTDVENEAKVVWEHICNGTGKGLHAFYGGLTVDKNFSTNINLFDKTAYSYNANTQELTWRFHVNRYNNEVAVNDVVITDILENDKLKFVSATLVKGSDTVTEMTSRCAVAPNEGDITKTDVTITLGDLAKGDHIIFDVVTKVKDGTIFSQQGSILSVDNAATATGTINGSPKKWLDNAEKKITNQLLTKKSVGDYDYTIHGFHWSVEVNPYKLPIEGAVLRDTLYDATNNGSSFGEVTKATRTNVAGKVQAGIVADNTIKFAKDENLGFEAVTISLSDDLIAGQKIFTFGDADTTIKDKYDFTFTTVFKDASYRAENFYGTDAKKIPNEVSLTGSVYDTALTNVTASAANTVQLEMVKKVMTEFSKETGVAVWEVLINPDAIDMKDYKITDTLAEKLEFNSLLDAYVQLQAASMNADGTYTKGGSVGIISTVENHCKAEFIIDETNKTTPMVWTLNTIITDDTGDEALSNGISYQKGGGETKNSNTADIEESKGFLLANAATARSAPTLMVKVGSTYSTVDASTGNYSIPIANATVQLEEVDAGNTSSTVPVKTKTTSATGSAGLVNLEKDQIYKISVTPGNGYSPIEQSLTDVQYVVFPENNTYLNTISVGGNTYPLVVLAGNYGRISSGNAAGGTISRKIVNQEGAAIEGVIYKLTRTDGKWKAPRFTVTGSDGAFSFDGLDAGDYTVEEVYAPGAYAIDSEPISITVAYDDGWSVTGWNNENYLTNDYMEGTVKVKVVDTVQTGESTYIPVAGGEYSINDAATSTNTAGEDGIVSFANIKYGATYTVEEKTSPTGYNTSDGENVTARSIVPTDFTITTMIGDNVVEDNTTSDQIVDWFESGLTMTKTAVADLTGQESKYLKKAREKHNLSIKILDGVASDLAEGVAEVSVATGKSFQLEYVDTDGYQMPEGTVLFAITDEAGSFTLSDIPYGNYRLVYADGTYVKDAATRIDVTRAQSLQSDPIVIKSNLKTVSFAVKKIDSVSGQVIDDSATAFGETGSLSIAKFQLKGTDEYGNAVSMEREVERSGEQLSQALFQNVPIGVYTLTEIVTPTGYLTAYEADNTTRKKYNVEVKLDGTVAKAYITETSGTALATLSNNGIYTVENEPIKGTITVTVKNDDEETVAAGRTYHLIYTDGSGVEITEAQLGTTLTGETDSNGQITFTNVPYGNYKLVYEDGNKTTNTGADITKSMIQEKISGTTYTIENVDITSTLVEETLSVKKIDSVTGKPIGKLTNLTAAKFKVVGHDLYGVAVSKEVEVNASGIAEFDLPLSSAEGYTLTEIVTPTGFHTLYQPSQTTVLKTYTVKVSRDSISVDDVALAEGFLYTIENTPITGSIVVDTQKVLGAQYEAASLGITRLELWDGEVAKATATGSKDENGNVLFTFEGVSFGDYTIRIVSDVFQMEDITVGGADLATGISGTTFTYNLQPTLTPVRAGASVTKIDLATLGNDHTQLSGAVFTVYTTNTEGVLTNPVAYIKETATGNETYELCLGETTWTTGNPYLQEDYLQLVNGKYQLIYGTYYVKETTAPADYKLDTGIYTLTIGNSDDGTVKVISNEGNHTYFTNEHETGAILIRKYEEVEAQQAPSLTGIIMREINGENRYFRLAGGYQFSINGEGTYTTESSGEQVGTVTVVKDTNAEYIIAETNTGNRFVTPQNQTVSQLTTSGATVEFYNLLKRSSISGNVTDSEGDGIANVVVGLYRRDGENLGSEVQRVTTGADGTFSFPDVAFGTYYVKEISVPESYTINTSQLPVLVERIEDVTVDTNDQTLKFVNQEAAGTIVVDIEKILGTNVELSALGNTQFSLYANTDMTTPVAVSTGEKDLTGKVTYKFTNVDFDDYTIQMNSDSFKLSDISVTKANIKAGLGERAFLYEVKPDVIPFSSGVTLTMIDFATLNTANTNLSNAVFTVYTDAALTNPVAYIKETVAGNQVYALAAGETSWQQVDPILQENYLQTVDGRQQLIVGSYYVKETQAPENFDVDTNVYALNINKADDGTEKKMSNEAGNVFFTNVHQTGTIVIETYEEVAVNADTDLTTLTAREIDGVRRYFRLKETTSRVEDTCGDYDVNAQQAEGYYKQSADQTVTGLTVDGATVAFYSMLKRGSLEGEVKGIVRNEEVALAGATIGLYVRTENGKGSEVARTVTGVNGSFYFGDIPYGAYYIQEIEVPEQYALSTAQLSVLMESDETIAEDTESNALLYVHTVKSAYLDRGLFYVLCQDAMYTDGAGINAIDSASFELYSEDGVKICSLVYENGKYVLPEVGVSQVKNAEDILYIDAHGGVAEPALLIGNYYVVETAVGEDYIFDVNNKPTNTFSVARDTLQEELVVNEPKTTAVTITKNLPRGNATTLRGFRFMIRETSGKYSDSYTIQYVTTDENGVANVLLRVGTYEIVEEAVEGLTDGYELQGPLMLRLNGEVAAETVEVTAVVKEPEELEQGVSAGTGDDTAARAFSLTVIMGLAMMVFLTFIRRRKTKTL